MSKTNIEPYNIIYVYSYYIILYIAIIAIIWLANNKVNLEFFQILFR